MGIQAYLRQIGRGRDGARALGREDAADLFGQVLDGSVTDLEVGAFCAAMRIKGETPQEMAGFLDAARARMNLVPDNGVPPVVLPSYNGSRRLPVLTPLLALLLADRGLPVIVHGTATEAARVHAFEVFALLGIAPIGAADSMADSTVVMTGAAVADVVAAGRGIVAATPGTVVCLATEALHPGLKRLLDVRRVVGLRNSAHSLVKLINPCAGRALVVGSYTHPEYAVSMAETFALIGADAMLLRGTEGEPVADPRRLPAIDGFVGGERILLEAAQTGSLQTLPELPPADPVATARFVRAVLDGQAPLPAPIATQIELLMRLHRRLSTPTPNDRSR